MKVSVVYNSPVVNRICEQDGDWLVTTHNRCMVKAQKVLEEGPDETESSPDPNPGIPMVSGFGVIRFAPAQAAILDKMLSENAQWLVTVKNAAIINAAKIEKPEEPAPQKPKRKRRTKKATEPKAVAEGVVTPEVEAEEVPPQDVTTEEIVATSGVTDAVAS